MGIESGIAAIIANYTGIGTALKAASAIVAIAKFAAVAYATSAVAKRAAGDFDPGLGSRTITKRGTIEPQQKIYGQALVAGTLAYINAGGTRNRELWAVHVLAGHECDEISDIWLDDRVISNSAINGGAAAGGAVTTGTFGPVRGNNVVEVYKRYGTSSQTAVTDLVSTFSEWTTDHRLRGHAYIATMFALWDRTETLWESGEPTNVRALVKGAIVYDPRLDTSPGANPDDATYFAWSDNPALCVADFLRDSKFSPFPDGIDPARIDWDAVETAADACDVLVDIPGSTTEKRFTCNGALYGTATPQDNLEDLLSSMNGSLVFSGGKYVIHAGIYEAPASGDDLDEDDIVGPIGISSALDSEARFNTIKATYIDNEKEWEATETASISIASYVSRDNGDTLEEQIELPFTSSWYMAQRICLKQLTLANQELTLTVPCNLRAARFVPGQRINLTITERGWNPKIFRVLDWNFFDRGGDQIGVNLELREDDSAAYADPDVADYNTRTAAGTLNIADPVAIPSIDTIPRGINYGEGAWSIRVFPNEDSTGTADDGEIRLTAGDFVIPGGTTRTLAADVQVNTPFEGSERPPDRSGFIVWGATNPDTRFAAKNWGSAAAEAAGIFPAVHDRIRGDWYAVANDGTEYQFTPADTDFAVARFIKSTTSGGLDSVTSVVAFSTNPQSLWSSISGTGKPEDDATNGADAGTNLRNSAGGILGDIDVRNDELVTAALSALNANPSMQLPRRAPGGGLCPASWYRYATANDLTYVDDALRDEMVIESVTAAVNAAFPVNPDTEYEVVALVKMASAVTSTISLRANEIDSDLASGKRAIGVLGSAETEIAARDRGVFVGQNASVGSSYVTVSGTYVPTPTAKWASLYLAREGGTTENTIVEWAVVRERSTRNTGALADLDFADTDEIFTDAVTDRVSSFISTGFNTAGGNTVTVANITISVDAGVDILLAFGFEIVGEENGYTMILEREEAAGSPSDIWESNQQVNDGPVGNTLLDTPGSGTWTYRVKWENASGNSSTFVKNRFVVAAAIKR